MNVMRLTERSCSHPIDVLHRVGKGVVSTVYGSPLCVGDTQIPSRFGPPHEWERECGRLLSRQSGSHLLSDGYETGKSGIGHVRLEARVTTLSGSQALLQGCH